MTAPRPDSKHGETPAPRHLGRAQKLAFRAIVAELIAAGKPVSTTLRDAIADYVELRGRMKQLERVRARIVAKNSDFVSERALLISVTRQLDAGVRLSERLAARIGL